MYVAKGKKVKMRRKKREETRVEKVGMMG